jgi:subtilase family serine protease
VIAENKERSHRPPTFDRLPLRWMCFKALLSAMLATIVLPAGAADGQFIAHNTPAYVATARNLRTEDPSQTIEVSIWLNPHNRAAMDALASDLYNPNSPNYRRWLKSSEIAARFAPTASEAGIVQDFFESHNLKVVRVGPNNFYVRARGTVADIEKAFRVQLNDYQVGNKILRASANDPYIEGPASALVQSVSGLDNGEFEHPLDLRPMDLRPTSLGIASSSNRGDLARAASAQDASFFQTVCFTSPGTETFDFSGTYPRATYTGNGYNSGPLGCAYSPANVYGAYNLNGLYAEGYTGSGQTIVILDWCGSPTILADANVFSKKFALPKLTSSNFNIIDIPTPSQCAGVDLEINLDVEWSHAIAPDANLDLVVPATAAFEDIDDAWLYAVNYGLGNVISGSFGSPEFFAPATELEKENLIAEMSAISGISSNFASGDAADYLTEHIPLTVSMPANLPYATGVGGVSVALNADNSILFQTGWETHESILMQGGVINDPPQAYNFYGFAGGAGGGPSAFFAKPPFQKGAVPGKFRQVPDISWLADPFTGVVVLISEPTQIPEQVWYAVGGTSVSTPMFSALWAIANQEAGAPLGQAAPYLYSLPPTTLTDVVPYTPGNNVTAVIEESSSVTHHYNAGEALEVVEPLFGSFYSTIWNYPFEEDTALVVSFGKTYYMTTRVGWDDITGVGTPNAKAFADWFAPAAAAKK